MGTVQWTNASSPMSIITETPQRDQLHWRFPWVVLRCIGMGCFRLEFHHKAVEVRLQAWETWFEYDGQIPLTEYGTHYEERKWTRRNWRISWTDAASSWSSLRKQYDVCAHRCLSSLSKTSPRVVVPETDLIWQTLIGYKWCHFLLRTNRKSEYMLPFLLCFHTIRSIFLSYFA